MWKSFYKVSLTASQREIHFNTSLGKISPYVDASNFMVWYENDPEAEEQSTV